MKKIGQLQLIALIVSSCIELAFSVLLMQLLQQRRLDRRCYHGICRDWFFIFSIIIK